MAQHVGAAMSPIGVKQPAPSWPASIAPGPSTRSGALPAAWTNTRFSSWG